MFCGSGWSSDWFFIMGFDFDLGREWVLGVELIRLRLHFVSLGFGNSIGY